MFCRCGHDAQDDMRIVIANQIKAERVHIIYIENVW